MRKGHCPEVARSIFHNDQRLEAVPIQSSRHGQNKQSPRSINDFGQILARLNDIDSLARQSGAFRRAREIKSPQILLRLILFYVCQAPTSIRLVAEMAAVHLGIFVSDQAIRMRFLKSRDFIKAVVLDKLNEFPLEPESSPGLEIRLGDATHVCAPGAKGTQHRLHVSYDPHKARFTSIQLTDEKEGECASRMPLNEGILWLGDRAYGHAKDLISIRARGAHALVRFHPQSTHLADVDDDSYLSPERIERMLRKQPMLDMRVVIKEKGSNPTPARAVAVPLPDEKAARARQQVIASAKKKGKQPSKVTLKLAGYAFLLTTLKKHQVSAKRLVRWYGLRWQIELLFKRWKSIFDLDEVNKASQALRELQIWARLLMVVLCQDMRLLLTSTSEWRIMQVLQIDLVLAIYSGSTLDERLQRRTLPESHCEERPRKRKRQRQLLADAEPKLASLSRGYA